MKKSIVFLSLIAAAAASQAVTFTNVVVQSPPLSNGAPPPTILGNSISFFLPNAIVGDGQALRQGNVNIQYDATSGPAMIANNVNVNLSGVALGSGTIVFTEMVIELDAMGNEVAGNIGTISHVFNSSTSPIFSGVINFSRPVLNFRAKKSFTLVAPDYNTAPGINDLAAIGAVNQSIQVVPEPATMTALGLGLAALARRRRNRK